MAITTMNASVIWFRSADNAVGRTDMPIKPIEIHEDTELDGIQKIYRFKNGYGASVVRSKYSYGNERGLWELAVIKFYGKGNTKWKVNLRTSLANDVVGNLDNHEVERWLKNIKELRKVMRVGRAIWLPWKEED